MKTSDRVNGPDRLGKNGAMGRSERSCENRSLSVQGIFAPDIKIDQL